MVQTRNQLRQEKTGKLIPSSQNEKRIRKNRNSKKRKGNSRTNHKGQNSQVTGVVGEAEKSDKEQEGVNVERNSENAPKTKLKLNNDQNTPRVEMAGASTSEGYFGNGSDNSNSKKGNSLHIERQLAHIERQEAHLARQRTGLMSMLRNLVHGGLGAQEITWTRCMHLLHTGDVNGAYREVIGTGDAFLLGKLLEETGPVVDQLTDEVSDDVIRAVGGQLLMEESYFDVALSWLQQVKEVRDTKKEEAALQQRDGEGVDSEESRLSDLPDALLVAILSLLNPIEAVKTCVLSKRWRDLWTFVPCILLQLRLHMTRVKGNILERLVVGCPANEELILEGLIVEMTNDISFHHLNRLIMYNCEFYNEQRGYSDFYISSSSLQYLQYYGENWCAAKFKGLSQVKEARISIFDRTDSEVYNCELLSSLSSVENLTITTYMFAFLHGELPKCPTFNCLKNLSLGNSCVSCAFGMWVPFLNRCPNLERIALYHGWLLCENNEKDEYENLERICCEQLRRIDIDGAFDLEDRSRIQQLIQHMGVALDMIKFEGDSDSE